MSKTLLLLLLLLLLLHLFNSLLSRTTWVCQYQKSKSSLDLNEARYDGVLRWQWHQLDHMQTICISLQTDNHTTPHHSIFYRPDALPVAQPTASKHRRHKNKTDKNTYVTITVHWHVFIGHQLLTSLFLLFLFRPVHT